MPDIKQDRDSTRAAQSPSIEHPPSRSDRLIDAAISFLEVLARRLEAGDSIPIRLENWPFAAPDRKPTPTPDWESRAIVLLLEGMKLVDIAEQLGVHRTTISRSQRFQAARDRMLVATTGRAARGDGCRSAGARRSDGDE